MDTNSLRQGQGSASSAILSKMEINNGGLETTAACFMKHKPFRGLSAILFKEFIVVWRDPMTLFFMFFPPLVEMIAFGYALDTDVKHMALVVFNEDRRDTQIVIDVDRVHHVLFVSIAVIAVHQHWKRAGMDNIRYCGRLLSQPVYIHIRKAKAHAIQREAAYLIRGKSGLLDHLCGERVAG